MRRLRVALLGVLLVLVGCRTAVDVSVVLDEDGSGTVGVTATLDADAAFAVRGVDGLVLQDLEQTGWELDGPTLESDGSLVVAGTHRFADEAELAELLDQVAGEGVFTDVIAEVDEGFASTTWRLALDVSVSGDPAQFSDEDLTALLDGFALGRTPEELAAQGVTEPGAGTLSVSVTAAGGETDSAVLDLGGGEAAQASVSSEGEDSRPLVVVLVALGALLLAFAVVAGVLALRRRRVRA